MVDKDSVGKGVCMEPFLQSGRGMGGVGGEENLPILGPDGETVFLELELHSRTDFQTGPIRQIADSAAVFPEKIVDDLHAGFERGEDDLIAFGIPGFLIADQEKGLPGGENVVIERVRRCSAEKIGIGFFFRRNEDPEREFAGAEFDAVFLKDCLKGIRETAEKGQLEGMFLLGKGADQQRAGQRFSSRLLNLFKDMGLIAHGGHDVQNAIPSGFSETGLLIDDT